MSPLAKVHSSLQSLYTAVLTKQPSTGAPSPAIHREHIAPVPSEQLKDQLEREGAERKQRRSKVEEGVDRDEPGVGKVRPTSLTVWGSEGRRLMRRSPRDRLIRIRTWSRDTLSTASLPWAR